MSAHDSVSKPSYPLVKSGWQKNSLGTSLAFLLVAVGGLGLGLYQHFKELKEQSPVAHQSRGGDLLVAQGFIPEVDFRNGVLGAGTVVLHDAEWVKVWLPYAGNVPRGTRPAIYANPETYFLRFPDSTETTIQAGETPSFPWVGDYWLIRGSRTGQLVTWYYHPVR